MPGFIFLPLLPRSATLRLHSWCEGCSLSSTLVPLSKHRRQLPYCCIYLASQVGAVAARLTLSFFDLLSAISAILGKKPGVYRHNTQEEQRRDQKNRESARRNADTNFDRITPLRRMIFIPEVYAGEACENDTLRAYQLVYARITYTRRQRRGAKAELAAPVNSRAGAGAVR